MNAQQTFIQLKFFPRSQRGNTDAGRHPTEMWPRINCPECSNALVETLSLEFCGHCGYVETDYWGLIKDQPILTTRRHRFNRP